MASIATIAPAPKPNVVRRTWTWLPFVAAVAFLSVGGVFENALEKTGTTAGYLVDASKSGEHEALMQAGGEFRIVLANLLWAKVVDHYHHEFIAHGGQWNKNAALLPLLQTIIQLDPHFTEAYAMMGSELLPALGQTDRGCALMKEGIKNNPDDWELNRELAILYAWREKKPALALPYAEAGLACAPDHFARNIMSMLCTTLRRQITTGR